MRTGARPRLLAALGDANDPATWSGIPHGLLQAGRAAGILDAGLSLDVNGWLWRCRRLSWNAKRVAAGDRAGGYQYSVPFLEALWSPYRSVTSGAAVINCFQLFPPSVIRDESVEKWFFIDQTLQQLFDHYGLRSTVGKHIAAEALMREREGYEVAAGVIVHSRWAARSVCDDYGVSPGKVHVVTPGANLDPEAYRQWEMETSSRVSSGGGKVPDRPLRLVFVGKDWKRKGLERLLCGFDLARRRGAQVVLRVIGCGMSAVPARLRAIAAVEWRGFLDKRRRPGEFLRLVAECDIGCLLSHAEAGGIALREFGALGLPVLATNIGGTADHVAPDAALMLPGDCGEDDIAVAIERVATSQDLLAALRAAACAHRRSALWDQSVRQITLLWQNRI